MFPFQHVRQRLQRAVSRPGDRAAAIAAAHSGGVAVIDVPANLELVADVGEGAKVGANAVVVKSAPADSIVVGIPGEARPARSTKEELRDAQFYIDPAIYI